MNTKKIGLTPVNYYGLPPADLVRKMSPTLNWGGLSKRRIGEKLRPYDPISSISNFDIGVYCKIMVRQSMIQGLGCFAISFIPKGTLIAEYTGERIDIEEAIRRNDCSSKDYSHYILTINERLFIDGAHAGNKSRFINHSCQPNCGVLRVETRAFIVARRTISCLEELTIDYDYDVDVRQPCSCRTPRCRGYI